MNTVNKVSKITNAMKLVSMSKLQKFQRNIQDLTSLFEEFDEIQIEEVKRDEECPILVVAFASDIGLASLYNQTLQKAVHEIDYDALMWLGNQGYDRLAKEPVNHLINDKTPSDHVDIEDLYDTLEEYIDDYQLLIAVPKMQANIVEIEWKSLNKQLLDSDFIVYEPNYQIANKRYREFQIYLTLYEAYYYSKFCENMTRRFAMEQATDNANDMREELQNQYNQIRQEEITREILELAAGVD